MGSSSSGSAASTSVGADSEGAGARGSTSVSSSCVKSMGSGGAVSPAVACRDASESWRWTGAVARTSRKASGALVASAVAGGGGVEDWDV